MLERTVKRVFSKPPTLMTRRLTLRAMKPIDSYDMFEYACRGDVTRYLTWQPHPSREFTKEYLEFIGKCYRNGEFFDWALIWCADGEYREKMIGLLHLQIRTQNTSFLQTLLRIPRSCCLHHYQYSNLMSSWGCRIPHQNRLNV